MNILEQLDEAEKAATPGPWKRKSINSTVSFLFGADDKLVTDSVIMMPDNELIVLMRNNIRALIDIARAADEMRNNSAKAPIHAWVRLEEALAKLEGKK